MGAVADSTAVSRQLPPERLETARLTLRRQQRADAAVFHRLWTERDERVPAHRRLDASGRPNEDDIAAHIVEALQRGSGLLTMQVRASGAVIGYCGVVFDGTGDVDDPEIAFELLSSEHNRGYATEAAQAVLEWAASVGFERIWGGVWEWNTASRRVLTKLGFADSGRERPPSVHGRNLVTVKMLHRRAESENTGQPTDERIIAVEHQDLTEAQLQALGALFDGEYLADFGRWDAERPYGYSPADVHTMLFRGVSLVGHVGYQRRRVTVGGREVVVAGTGGVLVNASFRGCGVGGRVMAHAQQMMTQDDRVDFGYLGCREEVVPFYERTGWTRIRAVERHQSMTSPDAVVESHDEPILIFAAGLSHWPDGDIDLHGAPW